MNGKNDLENMQNELYAAVAATDSAEKAQSLLADLCSKREIEQMAQRLRAAKLLFDGLTYNEVIEATGISSATLSRVSRCVQYGKGYSALFEKGKK